MTREVYRYVIAARVPIEEVVSTLGLAIVAAESLHGAARVRLDARHFVDESRHACVIDAATAVGTDLNRIFVGYLSQEFGDEAFKVERLDRVPAEAAMAASA